MKRWWYKLLRWEYWSANVVYAPTVLLWIWFMIKYKSLSFYKYSNPSVKNGGLFDDSKNEIYKHLPPGTYPKTVFVRQGATNDFKKITNENFLQFPFIVKPDIGCRGVLVQRVNSVQDLEVYQQKVKGDFLLQEICNYPNEIGLFYCRIPNELNGKITGITLKEFLTVTGNGKDNIEKLLQAVPRFEMQISKLQSQINLSEILPFGEKRCLVPFGNHNRGTKFLDGRELITEKLQQTFNEILKTVPGFYYGRLDIRYNDFKELEEGKNFLIIELNGAKSEPTHIYDPKHSFWYGQKEIYRHQKLFSRIIALNLKEK